jgi:DNA-binding transcriptional LysR family regulator
MQPRNSDDLWKHLHWLTVLAEQGTYTAAARRLGVSKAAMSQHISDVERAAGVPLVQRTTRSVRLTEAGQRLVDEMREPFDQIAHSFASIRDFAGMPTGLIRVTAPVAFARQQLVPHMGSFLRANPRVRLELDLSDRLSSLAMEGFDLAVRHVASPPDTHVAWKLCATRSVLVASRSYLRRRKAPTRPEELASHDCLNYPRPSEESTWSFEPRQRRGGGTEGRITVPIRGPFTANNSEALREAALDGLGIALLPDFSAQSGLRAGRLVEALAQWKPVGTFAEDLYAIRPYSSYVPRAVSAFVEWLRSLLNNGFSI